MWYLYVGNNKTWLQGMNKNSPLKCAIAGFHCMFFLCRQPAIVPFHLFCTPFCTPLARHLVSHFVHHFRLTSPPQKSKQREHDPTESSNLFIDLRMCHMSSSNSVYCIWIQIYILNGWCYLTAVVSSHFRWLTMVFWTPKNKQTSGKKISSLRSTLTA